MVHLSRQQLADMVGLRVETVIRSIKKLEGEGIIRLEKAKYLFNRVFYDLNHSLFSYFVLLLHSMNGQTDYSIQRTTNNWLKNGLFNLALVAFFGLVMRYKIAYSLPFIEQKNIQHAHSHFAFAAWITQMIFVLMIASLSAESGRNYFIRYRAVLLANLLTAYGMLVAFSLQGYALYSIILSTLSIFVSWWFAIMCWKDLNALKVNRLAADTFKTALLWNVISAAGPFYLAFMLATKTVTTDRYLASIYYYLHFQYNGWFFFGCLALFFFWLSGKGITLPNGRGIFIIFAVACLPAYFLSVLWLNIPTGLYLVVILAAVGQVIACILLINGMVKQKEIFNGPRQAMVRLLFLLATISLVIKLMLQLGSTVPFLSHLAFGFRPIIIGYLHLVLLGFVTLFLFGIAIANNWLAESRRLRRGLYVFITGIVLNELLLMIQGIAAIRYTSIPYTNNFLLLITVIMFTGVLLINISSKTRGAPGGRVMP